MTIRYSELNEKLIQCIPELESKVKRELEWWNPENPEPHILYGDILNFHLISLLESSDSLDRNIEELQRIFGLLEDMATSDDEDVRGVLRATICWVLTDRPACYERAKSLMGPYTLETCRSVEP